MGPWILRRIVRLVHRRTGYLGWDDVDDIDWDARTVKLRVDNLRPLAPT